MINTSNSRTPVNAVRLGAAIAVLSITVNAEDLTLLDGQTLDNVTVSRVEPDGVVIITDSTIQKVQFRHLSEETRAQYGYDPKKADQFAHEMEAAAARQAAIARTMQQIRATEAAIGKYKLNLVASIRQMFQNGGIVDAAVEHEVVRTRYFNVSVPDWRRFPARRFPAIGLTPVAQTYTEIGLTTLPQPIFIYGLPRTHVDGDSWVGSVWPVGIYRYTSDTGVIKTVRSYSTDRNHAFPLLQRQAEYRAKEQPQAL